MTFYQTILHFPFWPACAVIFILGACIGSFLNVIIYRVPIGPEKRALGMPFNINTPRSHCPVCQHQLTWYENIPLLSWLVQRAACRNCETKIPARYPAIELLVAAIGTTAWIAGESWQFVILSLVTTMVVLPALWWITATRRWNRFMLAWILLFFLATIAFGGYVWTTK